MTPVSPDLVCFATDQELIAQVSHFNQLYRAGSSPISDAHFDALFAELESRQPNHSLVTNVQTALMDSKGRIAHPFPMLSTEKAYESSELRAWLLKIVDFTGESLESGKTLIRISPKFDGCAARYDAHAEHKLVTRGDGQYGNDFTKLIAHGLVFKGHDEVGEVICDEMYFQNTLKQQNVAHPRNFVAGLISAETLSEIALKALEDGAVHYVSYRNFYQNVTLPLCEVLARFDDIEAAMIAHCDYRTDGVILQVHDENLFRSMGYGSRSHHAQLAKKIAGEPVEAEITGVTWGVGRSGRYTPVINIDATEIGGAMISNVTAHHAGNVRSLGIGKGAVGLFLRSGEVIPFVSKILKPCESIVIPTHCHCCETELQWAGDFLNCPNDDCKGRTASQLEFLAKTLGIDLIGGKAAEKLAEAGYDCVGFLSITDAQLQVAGFGAGQSANILAEIARVKSSSIDDFKVLASVGIHTLGRRASKNLLSEYPLDVLLSGVRTEQISALNGFADAKAGYITEGIEKNRELIVFLSQFFTSITPSKLVIAQSAPLIGLNFVFTGTLASGGRNDVERQAELLGAKVQSSVNGKTNFLVCGANVGQAKTSKAAALGVKVITENDYLAMIA